MGKNYTSNKELINEIINRYQPKTVEDMQDALKDIFGPLFEAMFNGEMNHHLGYAPNDKSPEATANRRNGYSDKTLISSFGKVAIKISRDRQDSFESQIIAKQQRDISSIEGKVLVMYVRGMSQCDISSTIEDIYGFERPHEKVSQIIDCVLDELKQWQNRPLKNFYTFLFVDCLYIPIRKDYTTKKCAVYTILGYDIDGKKDILGLWINDTESKHSWMQIFNEIKLRGVEDVAFISTDGVAGLEEGAKSIFKDVIVQRCIVHLIRNSLKYVLSKEYKAFTAQLKKIYGAASVQAARAEFERFKETWAKYSGAVRVWENNFGHIEQMFNYGSAVRKIMYTTNAIESVNSSFKKVIQKGSFENETVVFKLLYLRVKELYIKWNNRPIPNWAIVRNQLTMDELTQPRIERYELNS